MPRGGRTIVKGPGPGIGTVVGSYLYLPIIQAFTGTPGATTTNFDFVAPVALRFERCDAVSLGSSGGASRPTISISNLTQSISLTTIPFSISGTAGARVAVDGSSTTIITATSRDIAQNDVLQMVLTTVASEAISSLTVSILFKVEGFVRTGDSPANLFD